MYCIQNHKHLCTHTVCTYTPATYRHSFVNVSKESFIDKVWNETDEKKSQINKNYDDNSSNGGDGGCCNGDENGKKCGQKSNRK